MTDPAVGLSVGHEGGAADPPPGPPAARRFGRRPQRQGALEPDPAPAPWPGAPPAPAPAALVVEPVAAEVVDAGGQVVRVGGEGNLSAPPARYRGSRGWVDITDWAGPWTVEERWWDPDRRRRRANLQVVDATGLALLLTIEGGRWWITAVYD